MILGSHMQHQMRDEREEWEQRFLHAAESCISILGI